MQKVRIFAAALLMALLCGMLGSCFFGPAKPWEEGLLKDTFFSEDYISARGVEDFPVPKLEGSYFDDEKDILYLDLTREEFDAYTSTVVDYLRQKEALKVKGYHCGNDVWGLLIIPIRVYQLAPLEVEKISYLSDDERLFGFSTEEPNSLSNGEAEVKSVRFISLKWEPTTKDSGASYTTVMQFPSLSMRAEYLPCHHGHDFESVTYPVAGSVLTTTINTCNRCGEKTREGYGYGYEAEKFSWTVVDGKEYLVSGVHASAYRGALVEIPIKASSNTTVQVTANGTVLPLVKTTEDAWIYAFVMPYGDVSIVVETIDGGSLPPPRE